MDKTRRQKMSEFTYKRTGIRFVFVVSAILVLILSAQAFAVTYYIDGTNGNDTNSGTSVGTAFKTIGKAVNSGSALAAGDTVLVKAGVYRERLNLGRTGTSGNRITLKDYGDGEVIIDASTAVTGWTVDTGSIYKATPGFVVGNVVIDETALIPAVSVTIDQVGTDTTTRAAATISAGQWFQDQNTGILYVWTPDGSSPAGHTVGALLWTYPSVAPGPSRFNSIYDAIYGYNTSYWTFQNLTIRFAGSRGINMTGDSAAASDGSGGKPLYNIYDNLTVKFNNHGGILAGYHATIQNCTAYHNVMVNWPRGKWGATGGWPGAVTGMQATLFLNNTVHDNGGEGLLSYNDAVGNNIWRGNTVYDNWSVNIYTDNEAGSLIENNLVYATPIDITKMTNNGVGTGLDYKKKLVPIGIMTADEDYYQGYTRFTGAIIRNNLILGCKKATAHNRETNTNTSGIKNTQIINNTIVTPSGVFDGSVPAGSGDNYTGITIPYNGGYNTGLVVKNNLVIARGSANYALYGSDDGSMLFSGIDMDYNLWYNPDSSTPIHYGASSGGASLTVTQFKALSGAAHGVHDLSSDPFLTDLTSYTATSKKFGSTSVAKDAGVALASVLTDYFGTGRSVGSAQDIGFYEYNSGSTDSTAPTVSITAPGNNAIVSGAISVTANATDNVGVSKIEFYVNGVLQATDSMTPYLFSWNASALTAGVYTISAKAHDAAGNVAQSGNVSVTVVNDTTPPIVSVTAPGNNATVSGIVAITASAGDNVGVSKVEFYENGVLLSATNVAPYIYNWNTTMATNGGHTLTAKAYDAAGNVGQSSTETVTVNNPVADTTVPTTAITSPANNATVSGTVSVNASASDNVAVSKVEFYVNGTLKGTVTAAPFSFSWNTTSVTNNSYTLTAKAYDVAGNVGQSSTVTVTVNNPVPDTTPPSIAIGSPANNTTLSTTTTVTATASDNVGVSKVEFYVNGTLQSTDSTTPYSFSWNTTAVAYGTYTLTAKAYDAANNVATSSAVTVNVSNPVIDTTPPTVAITSPASGTTVSGTVTVAASATDNVAVSKVEFYVNGTLKVTDTASPYAYSWDTVSATNGSFTLTAKAYDAAGNVGQSSTVTVTINNPVTDTTPPITSITSPTIGATVSGTVSVATSTADNVAVTKVEFYVNGALFATDTTAPFGFSWDTTATADGAYDLTIKAYDAAGNIGQSAKVSVTVSNLAVTILNPTDGSTASGTTTVTTTTKGKSTSKVDLHINGKLYTTKTTAKVTASSVTSAESASLSFTWDTTTFANGTYTLTAVAYDDTGKAVQSIPVTAVVSNPVAAAAVKGDANGDGVVNVADALIVLKMATDPTLLTEAIRTRSDVAPLDATGKPLGDGIIDISDALFTLRKAVGLVNW
jgi:hypothetical protein